MFLAEMRGEGGVAEGVQQVRLVWGEGVGFSTNSGFGVEG
jgi:hypothetical protein